MKRPLVAALVTGGKYQPNPVLCQLGFNFDGVARLFTVPGLFDLPHLLSLVWIMDIFFIGFIPEAGILVQHFD